MTMADVTTYRFSRGFYEQMVDAGLLDDQNVELIDGEIVHMSPMNNPHVTAYSKAAELLREVFGKGFFIRVQAPLAIGDSEPQPDLAVVAGTPDDYKEHPASALLVVEVSDSSLRFDRGTKSSLYASAGVAEYWIVNLRQRQLEVFRAPAKDKQAAFGYRYKQSRILKPSDAITPLAAKGAPPLRVADMLP